MTVDVRKATLPKLVDMARDVRRDVAARFGHLTEAQLNWKPTPQDWSVGQCFDHILTSNDLYFDTFDAVLRGTKETRFLERVPVLPGLYGRFLIEALRPAAARKMPTSPNFYPTQSAVDPGIIDRFLAQQDHLMATLEALARADVDLGRVTMTSPASSVVTYSVLDGCRIIVIHEQHHIGQIQRLLDWPAFPRAQAALP